MRAADMHKRRLSHNCSSSAIELCVSDLRDVRELVGIRSDPSRYTLIVVKKERYV